MAKDKTRRGSPEAIAKRRAARALNTIFEKGTTETAIDGRTLKRKRRLMSELAEGKRGETLRAHEALAHITELLTLGETVGSIRKLRPRLPPAPPLTDETIGAIKATQESYEFDRRAWRLLGINIEKVMSGEGGGPPTKRAQAGKKARRRKKAA